MNERRHTKQVIVMRKDLNMRKGKIAAQAAHASMGVLTNGLNNSDMAVWQGVIVLDIHPFEYTIDTVKQDPLYQWFTNSFTKVCVGCGSEEELDNIAHMARSAGIPVCVITDNGTTEFNGVPTKTCCAIGPWWADEIDQVTGDLLLL